jgi:hypothetical protein
MLVIIHFYSKMHGPYNIKKLRIYCCHRNIDTILVPMNIIVATSFKITDCHPYTFEYFAVLEHAIKPSGIL